MQNPPDPRPVYEYDQVVTMYDLQGVLEGYLFQRKQVSKWNWKKRFMLGIAANVCAELLHWIAHGKPANGIKCRGGHNA